MIRRYQFDPRNSEELNRKLREGFVPLIKKTPGFLAYYWLDQGEGVGASFSVFENKTGAEESVRTAAQLCAAAVGRDDTRQA